MTRMSNTRDQINVDIQALTKHIQNSSSQAIQSNIARYLMETSVCLRKKRLPEAEETDSAVWPARRALCYLRGCVREDTSNSELWVHASYRGAMDWIVPALAVDSQWVQEILFEPLIKIDFHVEDLRQVLREILADIESSPYLVVGEESRQEYSVKEIPERSYGSEVAAVWGNLEESWLTRDPFTLKNIEILRAALKAQK